MTRSSSLIHYCSPQLERCIEESIILRVNKRVSSQRSRLSKLMKQWNAYQNRNEELVDLAFQLCRMCQGQGRWQVAWLLHCWRWISGMIVPYGGTRVFRMPKWSSYCVANVFQLPEILDISPSGAWLLFWKVRHIFKFCPAGCSVVCVFVIVQVDGEPPMRAMSVSFSDLTGNWVTWRKQSLLRILQRDHCHFCALVPLDCSLSHSVTV